MAQVAASEARTNQRQWSPKERHVFDRFIKTRAAFPYCADDYRTPGENQPRELWLALRLEHIQIHGREGARGYIVVDHDGQDAAIVAAAAGLPSPTIIATNPLNGHSHVLWELRWPIAHGEKHEHQLRWADAIERAFTAAMDGDARYPGLLVKNPLHDRWGTTIVDIRYSLDDLSRYVTTRPTYVAYIAASTNSPGRNVELFDRTRFFAYGHVKSCATETAFHADLTAFANAENRFATPLAAQEIRSIAKSVSAWTWARRNDKNGFVNRGACELPPMPAVMESGKRAIETARRRIVAADRTNEIRTGATRARIGTAQAELIAAGKSVTKATVARKLGISDRSLRHRRYSDLFEKFSEYGDFKCDKKPELRCYQGSNKPDRQSLKKTGTPVYSVLSDERPSMISEHPAFEEIVVQARSESLSAAADRDETGPIVARNATKRFYGRLQDRHVELWHYEGRHGVTYLPISRTEPIDVTDRFQCIELLHYALDKFRDYTVPVSDSPWLTTEAELATLPIVDLRNWDPSVGIPPIRNVRYDDGSVFDDEEHSEAADAETISEWIDESPQLFNVRIWSPASEGFHGGYDGRAIDHRKGQQIFFRSVGESHDSH